jgi:hypothetical protein
MFGQTAGQRMRVNGLSVGCVGAQECAGTGATGTEWAAESPICSGDSGGPALDAAGRVIGVASRGDPDCSVGIYSAVDSWKDLIVSTAIDAADDGGYAPPTWTGSVPTMDAGTTMDAGMDAGTTMDAGMDAGTTMDAGMDAGATMDAGMDAGATMDAGMDAGPTMDAGMAAGTTMDAGLAAGPTTAAGMMDAGAVPDAGTPDASMPNDGPPLGEECTSSCPSGYLCWAADGQPPGICVPPCTEARDCPSGYRCTATLGACTPRTSSSGDDSPGESGGCTCRTVGSAPRTSSPWLALGLALGAFAAARRRSRAISERFR